MRTGRPASGWHCRLLFAAATCVVFGLGLGQAHICAGQEKRTASVEVTEKWVSDRITGLHLGAVDGVIETPLGTIWVSDPLNSEVVSINPSEGTAVVVAREGEGPGEVDSPDRIARTPDGGIAVFDLSQVEIFTPEGRPLRRVRFATEVAWPRGFAVLSSGAFVVSGGIFGVEGPLHYFDPEGRLLHSWGDPPEAENWMARMVGGGGPVFAAPDGGLLYSQAAPHRIVRYELDPAGDSVDVRGRVVAEIPDWLEHPGDGVVVETGEGASWSRSYHPWFPQSRGVFQLSGGSVLNVVVFRDEGRSVWQVFGPAGELAAEGEVDVPYVPWFLCDNGDVLATRVSEATDVPLVVRLGLDW